MWLRARQWSVVWLGVATLCLATTLFQASRLAAERYRVSQLEESLKPLRSTQAQLGNMQRQLVLLRSRESMLAMLERMEQPVQLLGIVGRSVGGTTPEVQVYELLISPTTVVQNDVAPPASTQPQTPPPATEQSSSRMVDRVQLKIDGLGIDDLAVARFVAGLREAGVFDTVALKSSVHLASRPGECRQFSVECVFQ